MRVMRRICNSRQICRTSVWFKERSDEAVAQPADALTEAKVCPDQTVIQTAIAERA